MPLVTSRLSTPALETARALRMIARAVAIAAALALAWHAGGCGGGGGGGDGASPADEVAMGGGGASPCAMGATSDPVCEAVTLINVERASQSPPLPPLRFNAALAAAATAHDEYMVANGCFEHVCSGEAGVGARITTAGYAWAAYGETIGAGYGSAQAMVDGWMNSPGHRAILLGDFAEIGLHYAECPSGCAYGTYWSADFGTAQ